MKLLKSTKTRLVFDLNQREEALLLSILKRYPCVPAAHHVLSKSGHVPDAAANQRLLDEALAEQRAQNRQKLLALLDSPQRLKHTKTGAQLSVSPAEAEWLLQVLNDIRVGSWLGLGSPEETPEKLTSANARFLMAMELAGYFEMQLLAALGGKT